MATKNQILLFQIATFAFRIIFLYSRPYSNFPSSTLLRRAPSPYANMEATTVHSDSRPTIMVTNDDGIDAPGLRSLVRVLVSSQLYNVRVCAPDSYASSLFSSFCFLLFPISEHLCNRNSW